MKNLIFVLAAFSLLIGCKESPNAEYSKALEEANANGKIHWVSIEEAEKLTKTEPKKILVDAYTSWCGWCKKMDKQTFEHPEIAALVNENFYAVKYNAETRDTLTFKGKDYKFVQGGRRGYNELTTFLLKGRRSYPTISFLDENADLIDAFPGFKKADQFDVLLKFIGEEHYKGNNLNAFKATYSSEIKPL